MSDNTETLVEVLGFDCKEMVLVFAANVSKVREAMTGDEIQENPIKLGEIRDDVMALTKFGVEVGKLAKELRDEYDNLLKLMYEIDVLTPADVPLIHVPTPREGAGRKPMSAKERIAAAQKRIKEGKNSDS